jgi:hypothetical protein
MALAPGTLGNIHLLSGIGGLKILKELLMVEHQIGH